MKPRFLRRLINNRKRYGAYIRSPKQQTRPRSNSGSQPRKCSLLILPVVGVGFAGACFLIIGFLALFLSGALPFLEEKSDEAATVGFILLLIGGVLVVLCTVLCCLRQTHNCFYSHKVDPTGSHINGGQFDISTTLMSRYAPSGMEQHQSSYPFLPYGHPPVYPYQSDPHTFIFTSQHIPRPLSSHPFQSSTPEESQNNNTNAPYIPPLTEVNVGHSNNGNSHVLLNLMFSANTAVRPVLAIQTVNPSSIVNLSSNSSYPT